MNKKTKEQLICIAATNMRVVQSMCALILVLFLPCFAFADMPEVSEDTQTATLPSTQWWNVDPTQSISQVVREAGFLTSNEIEVVASRYYAGAMQELTNVVNAVAYFAASNTVDAMLTPSPLALEYGNDVTNSFMLAKNWVTQTIEFDRIDGETNVVDNTKCYVYNDGKLRNYSIVVENLPEDIYGKCINMSFGSLTNAISRIYATPAFYNYPLNGIEGSNELYGWLLSTNDIPCVISFRQPEEQLCIIKREKLSR